MLSTVVPYREENYVRSRKLFVRAALLSWKREQQVLYGIRRARDESSGTGPGP